MAGRLDLGREIEAARRSLTDAEAERYRALGAETSAALTQTILALKPEDREGDAAAMLEASQAFAWNPSAPGVKVEDTVVVGRDGVEVLSRDPAWPTVEAAGRIRPAILER